MVAAVSPQTKRGSVNPDYIESAHSRKNQRKGGLRMLTINDLIAILSLCLTSFGLGYTLGSNSKAEK